MIEVSYDAVDLAEWYYVVTQSFRFDSDNTYTQLRFVVLGKVSI